MIEQPSNENETKILFVEKYHKIRDSKLLPMDVQCSSQVNLSLSRPQWLFIKRILNSWNWIWRVTKNKFYVILFWFVLKEKHHSDKRNDYCCIWVTKKKCYHALFISFVRMCRYMFLFRKHTTIWSICLCLCVCHEHFQVLDCISKLDNSELHVKRK